MLLESMTNAEVALTAMGVVIIILVFGSGFVERLQTDTWESGVLPLLVASYVAGYVYVLTADAPLYVAFALGALFVLVLAQFLEPRVESGTRVFGMALIIIGLLMVGIVVTGGRMRVTGGLVGGIGISLLGVWIVLNPDGVEFHSE